MLARPPARPLADGGTALYEGLKMNLTMGINDPTYLINARLSTLYDRLMKIEPSMDVMNRCVQKSDLVVITAAGITAGCEQVVPLSQKYQERRW